MSSKSYWEKREEEALKHYVQKEEEFAQRVRTIYEDMLDNIEVEIESFYARYAKKEGISIADAKKRVSNLDIEKYARKAKRYVKDREFSKEANEEMRLYNLTMKVNRLELLMANIGLELTAGHDDLTKYMDKILNDRTLEELKRQSGILGESVLSNTYKVDAIVNASFHNATFSERIWVHQNALKADLSRLLQSGLIQGRNPRELARNLRKRFHASIYEAERLMRTELARVQIEAQKQSFQRNGFEEYIFLANTGCCPVCQRLHNTHHKVIKMMPGENAPPMHPNCRCSTAAYEDSEEYEAWLEHLEKGGTTTEWRKLRKTKWKNVENNSGSDIIKRKPILEMNLQFFAEKDIKNQESGSLKRSIRKFEKRIKEHEDYLEHPEAHCSDWNEKNIWEQEGLKKHWEKEIRNFKQSIANKIEELKTRGDDNG